MEVGAVEPSPIVRRAKVLRVHTNRLLSAFEQFDIDMTKLLLLDVEIELTDVEGDIPLELSDSEYELVYSILENSKQVVATVNKAICFASKSNKGVSSSDASSSLTPENAAQYDDVKIHYKPFTFDGNIRNWVEFWDRYNTSIYSRTRFSKVTKFSFLMECLKDKALELVRGLALTEANFETAISKLKERYDNPERLASSYYEELKELDCSEEASCQRGTFDSVQKILNNLEALGLSTDQDMLRSLIMSKFSDYTLRGALNVVQRHDDRTYNVKNLMTAIDHTLTIEEDIERIKSSFKRRSSEKVTTGTLIGGVSGVKPSKKGKTAGNSGGGGAMRSARKKKECVFCDKEGHFAPDCTRFSTMSRRMAVLRKKGLCFLCCNSHLASSCSVSEPKCSICHKTGHMKHLCVQHMISLNAKSKQVRERSSALAASSTGSGTFLQTFLCKISNPEVTSKSLIIRGILDQGSKKSYINEWICRELKIRSQGTSSLSCYHFGSSESYDINTHEVVITLGNIFNSSQRNYTLTSTPCITGDFRTCPEPSVVESYLTKNSE